VRLEGIAELEIDVEHDVALVAAELLEPGRVDAALQADAGCATLEAVAAERIRIKAGLGGASLDNAGGGAGIDRVMADAGQGVFRPLRPRAELQIRRDIGPSVIPVASCHRRSAHAGQRSVVPEGIASVTPRPHGSRCPTHRG
jgi:hypothetical protein